MDTNSNSNSSPAVIVMNNGSQDETSFTSSGPTSSEFEFFYAVSVFATRPHIVNRSIKGTELVLDIPESYPKFYSHFGDVLQVIEVPEDVVELLQEPFLKSLIDELQDLGVHRFSLQRRILGHSLREYISSETWDLLQRKVTIRNETEPNKELPPLIMEFSFDKNSLDENLIEIQVSGNFPQILPSLKFYQDRIVPKILKWASFSNSLGSDSHPSTAPGVPATSLKYVPVKMYYEEYKRLKDLYFKDLRTKWTEITDPLKFISEEMGIASYIKTFISQNTSEPFSFVDLGCGNGMLTFALTAGGNCSGYGFDIRSRKLWDLFPELGVNTDLRVQSFNPFSDEIKQERNLWLIGNHADELTPWISVLARKCNAQGYIVIPCCMFDFHGRFQRRALNSTDAKSLYQNYIHYIAEVGRKCGYNILIDKLRIPSTKRVCIIGTSIPETESLEEKRKEAENYAHTKISEFPSSDNSIGDIPIFKPRNPIERVNNLSQIDRTVVSTIVDRIFSKLISRNDDSEHSDSVENEMIEHPSYLRPWNAGRGVSLPEAANLLTRDEKDIIQKQGKGLQTLLKNNYQVFRIKNSCVQLRRPIIDDNSPAYLASKKKSSYKTANTKERIKTLNCYFNLNHPDGCPLNADNCLYKH